MQNLKIAPLMASLIVLCVAASVVNAFVRGQEENALSGDAIVPSQIISEARTNGGDLRDDCGSNFGLKSINSYPFDDGKNEVHCNNKILRSLSFNGICRQILHFSAVHGDLFLFESSHVFVFDGNQKDIAAVKATILRFQASPSEAMARWGEGVTSNPLLSSLKVNVSGKQCGNLSIIRFMER